MADGVLFFRATLQLRLLLGVVLWVGPAFAQQQAELSLSQMASWRPVIRGSHFQILDEKGRPFPVDEVLERAVVIPILGSGNAPSGWHRGWAKVDSEGRVAEVVKGTQYLVAAPRYQIVVLEVAPEAELLPGGEPRITKIQLQPAGIQEFPRCGPIADWFDWPGQGIGNREVLFRISRSKAFRRLGFGRDADYSTVVFRWKKNAKILATHGFGSMWSLGPPSTVGLAGVEAVRGVMLPPWIWVAAFRMRPHGQENAAPTYHFHVGRITESITTREVPESALPDMERLFSGICRIGH